MKCSKKLFQTMGALTIIGSMLMACGGEKTTYSTDGTDDEVEAVVAEDAFNYETFALPDDEEEYQEYWITESQFFRTFYGESQDGRVRSFELVSGEFEETHWLESLIGLDEASYIEKIIREEDQYLITTSNGTTRNAYSVYYDGSAVQQISFFGVPGYMYDCNTDQVLGLFFDGTTISAIDTAGTVRGSFENTSRDSIWINSAGVFGDIKSKGDAGVKSYDYFNGKWEDYVYYIGEDDSLFLLSGSAEGYQFGLVKDKDGVELRDYVLYSTSPITEGTDLYGDGSFKEYYYFSDLGIDYNDVKGYTMINMGEKSVDPSMTLVDGKGYFLFHNYSDENILANINGSQYPLAPGMKVYTSGLSKNGDAWVLITNEDGKWANATYEQLALKPEEIIWYDDACDIIEVPDLGPKESDPFMFAAVVQNGECSIINAKHEKLVTGLNATSSHRVNVLSQYSAPSIVLKDEDGKETLLIVTGIIDNGWECSFQISGVEQY